MAETVHNIKPYQLTFSHARWAMAEKRYAKARRRHRGQRRAWTKLGRWATASLRSEVKTATPLLAEKPQEAEAIF